MTRVSRTFDVEAAPSVVVPYLADFANAVQWDPGTVSCVREGSGPVEVGATWHNTSKIAGVSTELTYTLKELSEHRVVLVGRNDTATSTETIDVTPTGTGSTVTYTNETVFNGVAKVASPLVKVIFEKLGGDTERGIVDAVNGLPR